MRRVWFTIVAIVMITARAQEAFGQCSISTFEINGVLTLCADSGDAWEWSGPGGASSTSMCIEATLAGTYTLRTFDAAAGTWSDPCTHLVGSPSAAPACGIDGRDTTCAGQAVTWCGPTGDLLYKWTGPLGFQAVTSCIEVSVAGEYALTLTDLATGAMSEPCTKTLVVTDCTPAPAPPNPSPGRAACPSPPRWWANGCDPHEGSIDAATFARIAERVDAHSAVWSFGGTPEGLCELLSPKRHGTAYRSARRQFATVHANLAAGELGAADASGRPVGLSPDQLVDGIRGVASGTTLAEWMAGAEALLVTMSDASSRDRLAREECRRIRRQAHEINAGAATPGCPTNLEGLLADDDDLDDVLGGGTAALLTGGVASPLTGGSRLRWALAQSADVRLDVMDLSGRRVRHLVAGRFAAGTHEVAWDGHDDAGQALAPGTYFVTGRLDGQQVSQRLVLLR